MEAATRRVRARLVSGEGNGSNGPEGPRVFVATMGDLWRSQEMQLVQLVIPAEAAHDTVEKVRKTKKDRSISNDFYFRF